MLTRMLRRASFFAVFLLAISLAGSGCSSVTARVAGWYVTRVIDGYLDLTSEQRGAVRLRVDTKLDALRRDELPRWLYLLRRVRTTMDEGASDESLAELQNRYDRLMDRGIDLLVTDVSQMLAQLDDRQINHFQSRMMEQLEETYEEQLDLSADERREKLDKRLVKAIESITGELRAPQKQTILAKVHAMPPERTAQYEVGRERIRGTGYFLRKHLGAPAIEAELRRMWRTRYEVLGPGRGKVPRRAEQRDVLLTVDGSLDRTQRDHAVGEMNKRIIQVKRFVLPRSTQSAHLPASAVTGKL